MSKELPTTPKGWNETCGRSFTIEVSQPAYDHLIGLKTKDQIIEDLVFSSWWASWLPFDWMRSLAARYFARKAEKLYRLQSHK